MDRDRRMSLIRYIFTRLATEQEMLAAEALYDSGYRHSLMVEDATDEELLAVRGIDTVRLGLVRRHYPRKPILLMTEEDA